MVINDIYVYFLVFRYGNELKKFKNGIYFWVLFFNFLMFLFLFKYGKIENFNIFY